MVEFEKFLNRKLHPEDKAGKEKISIVFVPASHQKMPSMLEEGYGDLIAANLTVDPERQKTFDFSVPTSDNIRQVIVTGPDAPAVASLDDLAGKEVYVKASSTHSRNLQVLSAELEKKGKPAIRLVPADENLEDEDILEMVNAGIVSITLMDEHVADFWAKVFAGLKVRSDLVVRSGNSKGWMLRRNSPQLKTLVDEFVASHRQGTEFGNVLINRYLRSTKYVLNPVSKTQMEKFREISAFIREYAEKFDFDWLFIAAVAYQESQLDQSRRSPAGAVGIMQLMPATAAGAPIFIQDISKLENNIHAGVKLLRYIRDKYFDEPGLDTLNKTMLSLASYNAGPARIAQCRRKAKQMGLDPNVWFLGYQFAVGRGDEKLKARRVISKRPAIP